MKQILAVLFAAFLLLPLGLAQQTDMAIAKPSMMPIPIGEDLTLSQNHFYTVNFDGEGEAAVAAKITIQNTKKEPLDTVKLEIPGTSVRLINALQEVQIKKKRCGYWPIAVPFAGEIEYDMVPDEYRLKCGNWYDYAEFRYYSVERSDEKLSKSTVYTFTLPQAVGDQEVTKLILYYKAEGYTDSSLGKFDFDFETIKINQDINKIRVAVTVQDDLYLKGVESNVEYRGGAMLKTAEAAMAPAPSGVANDALQSFSNQIEWSQGLVKEAQGLDPMESFHVTGTYAKSRFALYQGGIFASIAVVLLVLVGLIFGIRRMLNRKAKPSSPTVAVIGAGVLGAVGMFVTWVVAFVVMNVLQSTVDYQMRQIVALLIMLVSLLITLALLIGTPVVVGYKHGVMPGLLTLGVMLGMLLVLTIIAVIFLIAIGSSVSTYGTVMY